MTSDLQNTYLYDAEGRICAVKEPPAAGVTTMVGYLYDAEGNRVGKGSIQQWNCNSDTNGFSLTNEYVLGQNGEQVTELDGDGGWLHTNAYAGGQMIATYDPQGLHYQISDWLGNRRVQTNSTGAVELTWQNLPFGELTPSSTLGATEHHFTGKERDAESGLDYFGARYYASTMGRWISPDWSAKEEPVPYAKLDDPQTLNLYSYVRNNPITRADLDGHVDWRGLANGILDLGRSVSVEISAGFGIGVKSSVLPGGGAFVGVSAFATSTGRGEDAGYKMDTIVSQGKGSAVQTERINTIKDSQVVPRGDLHVEKDLPEKKLGPVSTNGKEVIVSGEIGEGLAGGAQLSVDPKEAKRAWADIKAALKDKPDTQSKKEQPDAGH